MAVVYSALLPFMKDLQIEVLNDFVSVTTKGISRYYCDGKSFYCRCIAGEHTDWVMGNTKTNTKKTDGFAKHAESEFFELCQIMQSHCMSRKTCI